MRFETKNLDERAGLFPEMQTGLNHTGVVTHEQRIVRQQFGQSVECRFRNLSASIKQQFRCVATGERIFGDSFVGQRVVILVDADILWFLHIQC